MVMVPLTIKNGEGPRRPFIKNGNGDGLIYSDSIYSATRFLLKAVVCLMVLGF